MSRLGGCFLPYLVLICFFFFSSRRRHTRYWRDWSSDVCSSDLRQETSMALYTMRLSASLIPLLLAAPAWAHHPGGTGNSGGAGPVGTIPATTLDQGRVAAFVVYEFIRLRELSDLVLTNAASRHEHAHSIESIHSTSLGAAFGITNDLMLAVRLPFVTRTDIREGTHSQI